MDKKILLIIPFIIVAIIMGIMTFWIGWNIDTNSTSRQVEIICRDNLGNPIANVVLSSNKTNKKIVTDQNGTAKLEVNAELDVVTAVASKYSLKRQQIGSNDRRIILILESATKTISVHCVDNNDKPLKEVSISASNTSNIVLTNVSGDAEIVVATQSDTLIGTLAGYKSATDYIYSYTDNITLKLISIETAVRDALPAPLPPDKMEIVISAHDENTPLKVDVYINSRHVGLTNNNGEFRADISRFKNKQKVKIKCVARGDYKTSSITKDYTVNTTTTRVQTISFQFLNRQQSYHTLFIQAKDQSANLAGVNIYLKGNKIGITNNSGVLNFEISSDNHGKTLKLTAKTPEGYNALDNIQEVKIDTLKLKSHVIFNFKEKLPVFSVKFEIRNIENDEKIMKITIKRNGSRINIRPNKNGVFVDEFYTLPRDLEYEFLASGFKINKVVISNIELQKTSVEKIIKATPLKFNLVLVDNDGINSSDIEGIIVLNKRNQVIGRADAEGKINGIEIKDEKITLRTEETTIFPSQSFNIECEPGETKMLRVKRKQGSLTITLEWEDGNRPISGARVQITGSNYVDEATSSANGKVIFKSAKLIPGHKYTYTVRAGLVEKSKSHTLYDWSDTSGFCQLQRFAKLAVSTKGSASELILERRISSDNYTVYYNQAGDSISLSSVPYGTYRLIAKIEKNNLTSALSSDTVFQINRAEMDITFQVSEKFLRAIQLFNQGAMERALNIFSTLTGMEADIYVGMCYSILEEHELAIKLLEPILTDNKNRHLQKTRPLIVLYLLSSITACMSDPNCIYASPARRKPRLEFAIQLGEWADFAEEFIDVDKRADYRCYVLANLVKVYSMLIDYYDNTRATLQKEQSMVALRSICCSLIQQAKVASSTCVSTMEISLEWANNVGVTCE